jgi:hypothetical protein
MKTTSILSRLRNAMRSQTGLIISSQDVLTLIDSKVKATQDSSEVAKSAASVLLAEAYINILYDLRNNIKKLGILGALQSVEHPKTFFPFGTDGSDSRAGLK